MNDDIEYMTVAVRVPVRRTGSGAPDPVASLRDEIANCIEHVLNEVESADGDLLAVWVARMMAPAVVPDQSALSGMAVDASPGPWLQEFVPVGDEDGTIGYEPTNRWSTADAANEDVWFEADTAEDAGLIVALRNGALAEQSRVWQRPVINFDAIAAAFHSGDGWYPVKFAVQEMVDGLFPSPTEPLDRQWAEVFLNEWSRPYFGADARDALASVMRAARVAGLAVSAPKVTTTDVNRAAQVYYEASGLPIPSMTDKPKVVEGLLAALEALGVRVVDS
ncbi:hypothetical protein [Aeromicrobium sp. 179-A 4D2 NHS]|uniref:hypothetical protein n=1 Tax=Aeromicrobium sp. 179-A 4D2 NHS TaxID=3142375 RepID=UPI0039A2B974